MNHLIGKLLRSKCDLYGYDLYGKSTGRFYDCRNPFVILEGHVDNRGAGVGGGWSFRILTTLGEVDWVWCHTVTLEDLEEVTE